MFILELTVFNGLVMFLMFVWASKNGMGAQGRRLAVPCCPALPLGLRPLQRSLSCSPHDRI